MEHPIVGEKYKNAEDAAKGWSMQSGNGPAFIYLAADDNGDDAVFLGEYFGGKPYHIQIDKYFEIVKNNIKGAKLMAKSNTMQDDSPVSEEEATTEAFVVKTNDLTSIMEAIEELQENTIENLISNFEKSRFLILRCAEGDRGLIWRRAVLYHELSTEYRDLAYFARIDRYARGYLSLDRLGIIAIR